MAVTIGLQLAPQHGDMAPMRDAWVKAEELGVDRMYTADHFFPQIHDAAVADHVQAHRTNNGKNFEATTVQAAMAVTTRRVQFGCIVHAIGYRNPNLLADIARTIDHLSGGRFILGLGSGYLQRDYEEYGYEYGTQKSRLLDLQRSIPIIKSRFEKLNPPPLRKIPILIPSMGEKIGLRIVAEHADMWHCFGQVEQVLEKQEVLKRICKEVGRNYADIEQLTHHTPEVIPDSDPDVLLNTLGVKHIVCVASGPTWDLGLLRELLAWRDRVNARNAATGAATGGSGRL